MREGRRGRIDPCHDGADSRVKIHDVMALEQQTKNVSALDNRLTAFAGLDIEGNKLVSFHAVLGSNAIRYNCGSQFTVPSLFPQIRRATSIRSINPLPKHCTHALTLSYPDEALTFAQPNLRHGFH